MGDGGSGAMGGGGADAGAGGGGGGGLGSLLKPGVDLSPILPTGPTFTFQMPADAITAHPKTEGVAQQYGLVILFNIACAGHIEIVPIDPNNINPQQVPIGCFDSNHKQVGPEDWVFGYTRVYAYDTITNANPVIASIDKDGKTIASPSSLPVSTSTPPDVGDATLDVTHCSGDKCPSVSLGPVVPASSQETQAQIPGNTKEEIWADFYTTIGSYDADARLLYDSVAGSLGGPKVTNNTFHPPDRAGAGFLWIVVHDSRGGASWVTLPVHAN
jgi:hypothetical protein